jgi:hypothetical protein
MWNTYGDKEHFITIQTTKYTVTYSAERMQIGCQNHTFDEWWGFDDDRIDGMDSGALTWWDDNKGWLKQAIEANPAKPGKQPQAEAAE